MIAFVIAVGLVEIVLFIYLYFRLKELNAHIDTLSSAVYRTNKELNDFSARCMSRHSARSGIDFPNSRR